MTKRRTIDQRDHGSTEGLRRPYHRPRIVRTEGLPCGGTRFVFTGHGRQPPRALHHHLHRRYRPISDKRHFAGVKAARTRLVNRTLRRITMLLPGGPKYTPYADRIRSILEDVL